MNEVTPIQPPGAASTDLFDSQLRELCHALGWQGGTYHQVLSEVQTLSRMRARLRDPVSVHVALMRNEIARPELRAMLHVYGSDALDRWDALTEPTGVR